MQSKVHPTYKTKYRVANWPAYNRALVRRGDVTVWLSSEAIAAWTPRRSGRRGDVLPFVLHNAARLHDHFLGLAAGARRRGGPSEALIQAIVELTSRNLRFGCPRIARIIARTFGANIDKNVVYRVLSTHSRPIPGGTGPSWASFIGHTTDSLWSVDLCRGESLVLRSYWVLVVMDQCTRRLVGVGVHRSPEPACRAQRVLRLPRGKSISIWKVEQRQITAIPTTRHLDS